MKKVLLIAFTLLLVFSSMTACGGNDGTSTDNGSDASSGAPEYTIRYAHIENELTATAQGAQAFKKFVEEGSDGRIAVNILGAGSLGGEREILEGVIMGTLDVGFGSGLLSTYLPNYTILDLPFVFKDRADWAEKLDGEMGEILRAEAESLGVKILNFYDGGLRVISNNKTSIETMADFKGMKVRVGEATILIETHKALGDNPIPMAFGEVYTALQQGTIDGVDTSAIYVLDGNFQEVTKYCTKTNHSALTVVEFINKDFFDSLPADLQQVVEESAAKALVEERRIAEEVDVVAYETIEAAGSTINEPSQELVEQMVAATKPLIESYRGVIDDRLLELAGF